MSSNCQAKAVSARPWILSPLLSTHELLSLSIRHHRPPNIPTMKQMPIPRSIVYFGRVSISRVTHPQQEPYCSSQTQPVVNANPHSLQSAREEAQRDHADTYCRQHGANGVYLGGIGIAKSRHCSRAIASGHVLLFTVMMATTVITTTTTTTTTTTVNEPSKEDSRRQRQMRCKSNRQRPRIRGSTLTGRTSVARACHFFFLFPAHHGSSRASQPRRV